MSFSTLSIASWLSACVPEPLHVSRAERLRAVLGALIGIALTGVMSVWTMGDHADLPLLIAPMGATAVLLFAAPASPLAQPWPMMGGNLLAAAVGVTCARWIPVPILAAAVAVALAIGLMFACRCLHPPSGAVALTAVFGGPGIKAAGYGFVVMPVAINTAILLACAMLFHWATRHRYPHHASVPHASRTTRSGVTEDDIVAVLDDRDELLTIDADDLVTLVDEAEQRAYRRRAASAEGTTATPSAPFHAHADMTSRSPKPLKKSDFEVLSEFRHQLRRFLHFSEEAVQAEGITPLQYLLLLHIKGFPGREWATVGELAERMVSVHHGTVALVNRCVALGLVRREPAPEDKRQVRIYLTPHGETVLLRLAALHREELKTTSRHFQLPFDEN
jgi:CBS domain-containing membrane protein